MAFGSSTSTQEQIQEQIELTLNEIRQEIMYENSNVEGLKAALHLLEALACNDIGRTT